MNTHVDKTQEKKSQSVANKAAQKQSDSESTFQFVDDRLEAIAQRKLQKMANNSPRVNQLKAYQEMANNSPQAKQAAQLQAMANNYSAQEQQSIQKNAGPEPSRRENNTGIPDNLKSGIENLSGYSMDDVKVHYDSDKPAQLQAHAYAQGTDIHIASGQERHLPHEAWHAVQQKQGRVWPTMQAQGVAINNDEGLEREADVMGKRALQMMTRGRSPSASPPSPYETRQLRKKTNSTVAQLVDVGEGFNVTDKSTQANPWIYVSTYELDAPVNVVVGDNGEAPKDYIEYAQFCSVMSVEWLESGTTTFNKLSAERKKQIVEIALNNSTNEEQMAWGKQKIGGDDLPSKDIERLEVGKNILIYGPTHVTAAKRTKEGFTQYEPENGTVTIYSAAEFKVLFGNLRLIAS